MNHLVRLERRYSQSSWVCVGTHTPEDLSAKLIELQNKEPEFAIAAVADCILPLDALINQHCKTDPEMLQIICGSFGFAISNAATLSKATVIHCNDDEVIYDYSIERIKMDID